MTGGRHCILNFHGLGTPHAGVPGDERPYWLDVPAFTAVADRVSALVARGEDIRITFDDGNLSDLAIAAPILRDRRLEAEFFVLTGRLDQPHYLTPGDVRALLGMGMRIGLHGEDHLNWTRLDAATFHAETVNARETLSRIAGRKIDHVGIPFGAYDRRVIAGLKKQGFSAIFTSDGGFARNRARIRPRTSLRGSMTMDEIEGILAGRAPVAARLRRGVSCLLRRYVL